MLQSTGVACAWLVASNNTFESSTKDRNISKKKFTEKKSHFYWSLYTYLLLIQHSILHLYEECVANQINITSNDKNLFIQVTKYFESTYSSFFKKDQLELMQNNENLQLILTKIKQELKKAKSNRTIFLYYLGELTRLIYLLTTPIQGVLLD